MRVTAFTIILFFLSLNLSLFVINETQVLGRRAIEPYTTPNAMVTILTAVFGLLIGSALGDIILGKFIYGGAVGLIIAAAAQLVPVVNWIFLGFPIFLGSVATSLGVSSAGINALITAINVLMAAVWCWFILGFMAQRQLET